MVERPFSMSKRRFKSVSSISKIFDTKNDYACTQPNKIKTTPKVITVAKYI